MSFLSRMLSRRKAPVQGVPLSPEEARLREMFDAASSIVVITGAGLSAGSGLLTHHDKAGATIGPAPIRYRHFLVDPEARLEQWRRSLASARDAAAASPNAGHLALTAITRTRRLKVVTLNTDGLHARAGLHGDDHVELNGNMGFAACMRCGARTPIASHSGTVTAGRSPTCEHDGDLLKPTVALFGEPPHRSALIRAEEWATNCDLFIAVGTSLSPGSSLQVLDTARQSGAKIAVVNLGRPVLAVPPDVFVEADAAMALNTLA